MHCLSRSPAETRALGRRLAAGIGEPGLVVALEGRLGSGKSVFVRGLAEGLGVDPARIASPTFVIATHHEAEPLGLVHVDLYRVESRGELLAAGWLDWLVPGWVVAVEWADRLPEALPADRLEVRLERGSEVGAQADASLRRLMLRATGSRSRAALARALQAGEIPASQEPLA